MSEMKQIIFIRNCDVINETITLQEACEILGCADSTLRTHVLKGKFKPGEYRKAKGTILFYKKSIEQRIEEYSHLKRK